MNKDIAEEKQTMKVMTALKDPHWEDWVEVHYDVLKMFLEKIKDNFIPADWETDVHIELNAMSQTNNQSFCDFTVAVQNKNSLLKNTELYLDNTCLCTPTLNKCSQSDKKFHLIKELQPQIKAVKELVDTLQIDCAKCHAEMEATQKALHQRAQDECLLAELPC